VKKIHHFEIMPEVQQQEQQQIRIN